MKKNKIDYRIFDKEKIAKLVNGIAEFIKI
jgi:hypothetical protein